MAAETENLARRFAKAFIDAALETADVKIGDPLAKSLDEMTELAVGEVGAFFSSPVFDRQEKLKVLDTLCQTRKMDPLVHRFLQQIVMLEKVFLLPHIAVSFRELLRERRNETEGWITSAMPLSKGEEDQLVESLSRATGKKVKLRTEVNKDLIGGMIARVGSVIYDASIRGYLQRLEQEF